MKVDVAVGEVSWERELLSAIARNPDVELGRRHVDLATLPDARTPLIVCPSVRGFTEAVVPTLATRRPLLVLVDSIRPPWLADSAIPCTEVRDIDFDAFVAKCAERAPSPRLQLVQNEERGRITAFVGVSGGVGVTTLAWLYAQQRQKVLLIDCNLREPALSVLLGNGTRSASLSRALQELRGSVAIDLRTQVVRMDEQLSVLPSFVTREGPGITAGELSELLVVAAEQFAEVVLDLGTLGDPAFEVMHVHVDRLHVVADATPLGLVRLCSRTSDWAQSAARTTIVVNRVRSSAAGSRHAATAIRNLVLAELGSDPLIVADRPNDCDRGWLSGDWSGMRGVLGAIGLPRSA